MRILVLLIIILNCLTSTGQEFTVYTADNGFVDAPVTTLFTDSQGRVWVGIGTSSSLTSTGVYMIVDGEFIHHEYYSNGLTYNVFEGSVTDFAEDSEGNIWIGVSDINQGGIYKFDGVDIHLEYITTDMLTSAVSAIFIDTLHNDELWVACRSVPWDEDDGGLQIFKEDTIWTFSEGLGNLLSINIIDIQVNPQNDNIGIAGKNIPYLELNHEGEFFYSDIGYFDNNMVLPSNIEYGGLHDIWLSTKYELLYYEEDVGWGAYNGGNKPSGNEIECIYKDQDGIFWSYSINNTYNQYYVDKLVDTTWVNVGILDRNVLPFLYPFILTDDQDNNLWMALRNGIAKLPKPNATSSDIVQVNTLKIYPNPANQLLRIESPQEINYILYNPNGQEVAKGTAKEIDTSHLENGLYFLQMEDQNVQKIIIQH